jgi:glycosyltransferase involved in cell wall biosynthesis
VDADPDTRLAETAADLCDRLGIPFVLFSDAPPSNGGGMLARRRAQRVVGRAAGLIGSNRGAERRLSAETTGTLCTTLPRHGVVVPATAPREPGPALTIGFVGRLVPDRGLDFLLQGLAQTYGNWQLTVLGTGPEQEVLEALAGRHGLASRIRWWGGLQRESLDRLWAEIDCFVVPWRPTSTKPHAPLLLDAMARGIAPIVTDTEPLPELVGDTGPVVGSVEELTEAMQAWVADPSRAAACGGRARQRVLAEFVTSVVGERLVEFWRAAAADRKLVTS